MKAAFMTGVDAAEVRETADPALEPAGAILRVEACGICGTDARTFFNGDPRAPAPRIQGAGARGSPLKKVRASVPQIPQASTLRTALSTSSRGSAAVLTSTALGAVMNAAFTRAPLRSAPVP